MNYTATDYISIVGVNAQDLLDGKPEQFCSALYYDADFFYEGQGKSPPEKSGTSVPNYSNPDPCAGKMIDQPRSCWGPTRYMAMGGFVFTLLAVAIGITCWLGNRKQAKAVHRAVAGDATDALRQVCSPPLLPRAIVHCRPGYHTVCF
jgi:hypothetical protein